VYSFPCICRPVARTEPCIHLCNLPRLYSLSLDTVHPLCGIVMMSTLELEQEVTD
jgi:hypothetical protein